MSEFVKPTGGCIKCAKCERVRTAYFCGRKKLTNKQLYNDKGYCSKFVPSAERTVRSMTLEECATCPRYSAKEQRQRNRLYCVFCCKKHIEQASKNALKYNLSVSGEDFGIEPEYEHENKVYGSGGS